MDIVIGGKCLSKDHNFELRLLWLMSKFIVRYQTLLALKKTSDPLFVCACVWDLAGTKNQQKPLGHPFPGLYIPGV